MSISVWNLKICDKSIKSADKIKFFCADKNYQSSDFGTLVKVKFWTGYGPTPPQVAELAAFLPTTKSHITFRINFTQHLPQRQPVDTSHACIVKELVQKQQQHIDLKGHWDCKASRRQAEPGHRSRDLAQGLYTPKMKKLHAQSSAPTPRKKTYEGLKIVVKITPAGTTASL
jgi:hypothetical protein